MLSVNCLISSFRRSAFCMSGATSTTGPLWRSAISATRVAQAAPVNSPSWRWSPAFTGNEYRYCSGIDGFMVS
jgi:hypothetical protein